MSFYFTFMLHFEINIINRFSFHSNHFSLAAGFKVNGKKTLFNKKQIWVFKQKMARQILIIHDDGEKQGFSTQETHPGTRSISQIFRTF